MNYIEKFGLPIGLAQYINSCFIFHDIYINDLIRTSDIELNLWVSNCFKSYQLRPTLVIYKILDVFCDEFHRWGNTKFSKLNQDIRSIFKETFMAKKNYMDTSSGYINQRLANLIINKLLLAWDKNNLYKYKLIYSISKIWLFFKL